MSDPSAVKKVREQSQVRAFLEGIGMLFQDLGDGPDPPDIHVFRAGLPRLDIEVSEYHPTSDRVEMEERSRAFLAILNGLIEPRASLNGVAIRLLVKDAKMPRRSQQRAIAEELVQCIESVLRRGWISEGRYELLFLDYVIPGTYDQDVHGSLDLSAKEWPIVAEHMLQVDLHRTAFDFFFPAGIYQAQFAMCSPRDDSFRAILERKKSASTMQYGTEGTRRVNPISGYSFR